MACDPSATLPAWPEQEVCSGRGRLVNVSAALALQGYSGCMCECDAGWKSFDFFSYDPRTCQISYSGLTVLNVLVLLSSLVLAAACVRGLAVNRTSYDARGASNVLFLVGSVCFAVASLLRIADLDAHEWGIDPLVSVLYGIAFAWCVSFSYAVCAALAGARAGARAGIGLLQITFPPIP